MEHRCLKPSMGSRLLYVSAVADILGSLGNGYPYDVKI